MLSSTQTPSLTPFSFLPSSFLSLFSLFLRSPISSPNCKAKKEKKTMPLFSANLGSFSSLSFLSQLSASDSSPTHPPISSPLINPSSFSSRYAPKLPVKKLSYHPPKVSVAGSTDTDNSVRGVLEEESSASSEAIRQARISADWEAARTYYDSGLIYDGRILGFNGGGLLIQFNSLVGFLPFPQLCPSHSCKERHKNIQEIAKGLVGSLISIKIIGVDEDKKRLIFSEKKAAWSRYSTQVNVGDTFEARVGSVEDYGAFVHLRFPDGQYYLTGLVHISEVSWDLVHDVRDILTEGDEVRVKVLNVDREKSRIALSMKQLEEDPLLETLDKVIPQDDSLDPDNFSSDTTGIEPLPGLETILEELLKEDGIEDARISRQGFEKRVVSQDLQLWLSNAPPINQRFTLLARAGRQVQEIHLTTMLDQDGIKKTLQRVLERIP